MGDEEVRVYVGPEAGSFANTLEQTWVSEAGMGLHLWVSDFDPGASEFVGPDSLEEILLDETHPAVIIQGGWDADHKVWNNTIGLRLRWRVDDLNYDLLGADRELLIMIAKSTLE